MDRERIKVMYIEDNQLLWDMYKLKLEKEWCTVWLFLNGAVALNNIEQFDPDIIVTDLMMPVMDWLHTIEEIKKIPKFRHTKILTFSNLSNQSFIDKSKKIWADEYILKSWATPLQLYYKIREMLELPLISDIS